MKKIDRDFWVIVFEDISSLLYVFCEKDFQPITELKDINKVKKFLTLDKAKFYAEETLQGIDCFDFIKLNEVLG